MSEFQNKLKAAYGKINENSFIRLARGENRKNNLRKSRRTCLIVFTCVVAFMCLLYTSINSNMSIMAGASPRKIDMAKVDAKIVELQAEIDAMKAEDVSDYGAADLNTHNNNLENYTRSIAVLEELKAGDYDGKEYSVKYVDVGGELATFGTVSWGYNNIFRSYVLDFLTMLIAIFISITVANVFGAEYGEKTVKLMFTKPSSRIKLFLCKMAVVIKEAFIYSAIGFTVLLLINWANTGSDFMPMLCYIGSGVRVVSVFEQIFLLLLDICTDAIFYASLAAFFSIAAKSRVLPIICTILFSRLPELESIKNFMVEIAGTSVGLYNCIFSNHINLCQYIGFTQLVVNGTGFTVSYIVMLVYTAALFTASMLAFNKQRAMNRGRI